jgi:hypothetical protein
MAKSHLSRRSLLGWLGLAPVVAVVATLPDTPVAPRTMGLPPVDASLPYRYTKWLGDQVAPRGSVAGDVLWNEGDRWRIGHGTQDLERGVLGIADGDGGVICSGYVPIIRVDDNV